MSALVRHEAIFASLLVGCTAYHPGSFTHGVAFIGQRATVGCLDVAVARRVDYESNAVLQYQLGNRCNRPVEVNLGRIAVIARFADGSEEVLAPYDPSFEIRPVRLTGRLTGQEAIAYPIPRRALQICAELSAITPVAVARAADRRAGVRPEPDAPVQPPQWLCFGADSAAPAATAGAADSDAAGGAADDVPARPSSPWERASSDTAKDTAAEGTGTGSPGTDSTADTGTAPAADTGTAPAADTGTAPAADTGTAPAADTSTAPAALASEVAP